MSITPQHPEVGPASEPWADELGRKGAIVLPQTDGTCLVVDAVRPWRAIRVTNGDAAVFEKLCRIPEGTAHPGVRACGEVHYVGPWPASDAAVATIHRVARTFGSRSVRLLVHFTNSTPDLTGGLLEFAGPRARCAAQFVGRLPELDEDTVSHLLARGASVLQTAGWPAGGPIDTSVVARMSEFGLRIPVLWYVHRDNVSSVLDEADQILDANYDAGVAFEPISAHPLFSREHLDLLPSPDEYADLLVDAYRRFRHYDDVFEPFVSLIRNLREGAWEPRAARPLPIRLRIDAAGRVREFRQIPGLYEAGPPATHVGARLISAKPCQACEWEPICGGCEAAERPLFDLVCEHRMLFLEFFLRQMHEAASLSGGDP